LDGHVAANLIVGYSKKHAMRGAATKRLELLDWHFALLQQV
jgi:hypothetical protein